MLSPDFWSQKLLNFIISKKISSPLFRCPGAVFFEGEKSRKVDSRFLHAVSLHRRSDGCGPSVVAPHDFIVRINTINPLFFFFKYTPPGERRVGQKIWNTIQKRIFIYSFLPLSLFIQNSSWTNAKFFPFINCYNEWFIPILSYYRTKQNYII